MITEQKVLEPATSSVTQVMDHLTETAKVEAVFGQPIEHNGIVVIPCSEVSVGLGMGFGSGPAVASNAEGKQSTGSGGGGGGGATGRPIAIIIMSKDGVRVQPVVDATKVVLTTFATLTFILLWIGRLLGDRRRASLRKLRKAMQR
ncbi:MAG TPA: spore germination protein GerW family protein [Ktedonobacteraceae bacterium]|nr:spore germination protein GerW family protein [Ktedonobacteraceae bacterium]